MQHEFEDELFKRNSSGDRRYIQRVEGSKQKENELLDAYKLLKRYKVSH